MDKFTPLFLVVLTLLLVPVYAATDDDTDAAAAQVEVAELKIDPAVLMPYDTAMVTIILKNTGTKAVHISHALIYDKDLKILTENYGKVGFIGAGNNLTLEYTIQARANPGIFYPTLSLDFQGARFLRNPFRVLVQEEPLEISVLSKPEIFIEGKKDLVYLHVANPRDNTVTGAMITVNGTGHEITPISYFIGTLPSDAVAEIPFNITPYGNHSVEFSLSYQNGINKHNISYSLPVNLGESRKRANPVISNVVVEDEGNFLRVTGDVTNSGLETANAVEITSAEPALPIFPYKIYAVGALKPDDFSSFDITFRVDANATEVPLRTSFKDRDGNIFVSDTPLEIDSQAGSIEKDQPSGLPKEMMFVVIGVVLFMVIISIWFSRRN